MSYIPRVLAVLVGVRTDTLALGWSGSCPAYTYKHAHWWCPGVARSWGELQEPRTQHVSTHTQHTQHTYKYKGTHTEHTYTYKGTHKHTQTQLVVQQPVYDHQKHKHIGNQYQQSGLEQGSGTTTSLSSTMRLTLQTRSATEAARARCDCMAGPVHTCECLPANGLDVNFCRGLRRSKAEAEGKRGQG